MKEKIKIVLLSLIILLSIKQNAQTDSITNMKTLGEVEVRSIQNITGMGHMKEVHDGIIYSGKKMRWLF